MLWMGALKAGSRMRWMDMLTANEAHVDPAALLIIRTEADVRALLPLVSDEHEMREGLGGDWCFRVHARCNLVIKPGWR